ncbi:MAG: dinuclear metal center protein, YbgI/SA1388 family [halophilic archaeon J07HB67]|nr:MAG: dinuclear metal center protein, YbgI/SA1388 family [halophilic archaeon J07HB67]
MQLQTLADRLDEELRTAAYAELDASANGLQIGPTTAPNEIDHVAFAVDAVAATATAAAEAGADLLVTHHGVVWGGLDRVTGRAHDRVTTFTDRAVALYVSHLPLDGHQELGNAAGVADLLGLESREPFGTLGPEHVGQFGVAPEPYEPDELADLLERELDHGGEGVQLLDFGPTEIERVAVLTGSGSDWLDEAVAADADALVTGEAKGKLYHEAREAGLTVFLGGHYATETFGVAALADLVADWGVETTVIDHPTGL